MNNKIPMKREKALKLLEDLRKNAAILRHEIEMGRRKMSGRLAQAVDEANVQMQEVIDGVVY